MALPDSGPITLQMIADEFGGTPPLKLTDYYGVAAGIPTSGPITLKDFYGASDVFMRGSLAASVTDVRGGLDSQAKGDQHLDFASIASDGDLCVLAVSSSTKIDTFGTTLATGADQQNWVEAANFTDEERPASFVAATIWDSSKRNPYFSMRMGQNGEGASAVGVVFNMSKEFAGSVDLSQMEAVEDRKYVSDNKRASFISPSRPIGLEIQVLHIDMRTAASVFALNDDFEALPTSQTSNFGSYFSSTGVLYRTRTPPNTNLTSTDEFGWLPALGPSWVRIQSVAIPVI